jgi:hypothetical protein
MQECKLDLINQLLGAFEFTEKPASKQLATWNPEIPVILLPEALGQSLANLGSLVIRVLLWAIGCPEDFSANS